ncbi:MAG: anthranilate synthase component I, partial [Candidatus Muproteobacteria bacterium RBG_16_64_10]
WGRYSIIGLPARTLLRVIGHDVTVEKDGKIVERETVADPLDYVRTFKARYTVPAMGTSRGPRARDGATADSPVPGLPRFTGGLVGYFGYETIRYVEPRLGKMAKPDAVGAPDILLMVSDEVVVFDNLRGKLYVVIHVNPAVEDAWNKANQRLDELVAKLNESATAPDLMKGRTSEASRASDSARGPRLDPIGEGVAHVGKSGGSKSVSEADFVSAFTQEGFEKAVGKSLEYIRAGDIMQVVLSQRLTIPYAAAPLDLYRALRTLNPSPYMYFMDLGDLHIVGSSPEILVRLEDGQVTVRPIAGTRPRGATEAEDQALEKELLTDPKERAEHIMLVDLGRNDVGRVARTGSVRVTDKMMIERYSHVMHIVSNVTGELKPDMDAVDVLRATFPAGTVSGAPKVRAMEIIEELEPTRRGIYSGAVGYIGWNGNMDTAIAIRTAVIRDKTLYIQAGAGIVADSVPRSEWNETMNKARAIFRAVAMACKGL